MTSDELQERCAAYEPRHEYWLDEAAKYGHRLDELLPRIQEMQKLVAELHELERRQLHLVKEHEHATRMAEMCAHELVKARHLLTEMA